MYDKNVNGSTKFRTTITFLFKIAFTLPCYLSYAYLILVASNIGLSSFKKLSVRAGIKIAGAYGTFSSLRANPTLTLCF